MFASTVLSLLFSFILSAEASPTPQYPGAPPTIGSCAEEVAWKDITSTPSYQGDWQMMSAETVTSNEQDPATLTATYSVGISVTITEGFSIGLNLPDEVGTIGFDSSVTWGTTTTTGFSEALPCPQGTPNAYICGLSGRPYLIDVSGTKYKQYNQGNCLNPGATVEGSEEPFKFTAPVLNDINNAPDSKPHAAIQYGACICQNSMNTTTESGLGMCPGKGCG